MGRKEEIKEKILSASVEEFISKGLNAASMEQIAKSADVSKRTLYKYYPSKDQIFDAIVSDLLVFFCQYSNFNYVSELSIEEQIEDIIETKVELITSDEYIKISKLVLSELLKSKQLNQDHLASFNESEQNFVNWIEAAKKDGKVTSSQSCELIANQFHSILKGQIFYPVIWGIKKLTPLDIENSKKTVKDFFLNLFCK
ncbi:hypothetical protein A9Q84_15020 [Halobacteriovorax marinus]|uniref:HTH tetR-type domain-containing protein n=1 Tax=Halobacteriovorax marinus TaxID=97084 RepID=A0A1Y5F568_9BACT|nr:hypothetical protein A9Q84_15020 [Halobacteriovorax marinus]